MEKNISINNSYIKDLQSADLSIISTTIEKIKSLTGAEYLPHIIDALLDANNPEVKDILTQYLYDIKLESVKGPILSAIKDPKYKSILPNLVSACWQNGISFKDNYILFTDIFIKENFSVSIEAFSVIESILDDISDKEKELMVKKLKASISKMDETKRAFTSSLVKMITE